MNNADQTNYKSNLHTVQCAVAQDLSFIYRLARNSALAVTGGRATSSGGHLQSLDQPAVPYYGAERLSHLQLVSFGRERFTYSY